jgi:hypothetical protein
MQCMKKEQQNQASAEPGPCTLRMHSLGGEKLTVEPQTHLVASPRQTLHWCIAAQQSVKCQSDGRYAHNSCPSKSAYVWSCRTPCYIMNMNTAAHPHSLPTLLLKSQVASCRCCAVPLQQPHAMQCTTTVLPHTNNAQQFTTRPTGSCSQYLQSL